MRNILAAIITIALVAYASASVPLKYDRPRPRDEWNSVVLDGFIVDTKPDRWGFGRTKSLDYVNSMNIFADRRYCSLLFSDDRDYRNAERLIGEPVFITAIPVQNGDDEFYVVESIRVGK